MKRESVYSVLLALALQCGYASAVVAQPSVLDVQEHELSNGMKVWLNEDHSQPKVFGAVVVNAGAKDCPNTGIAHYFEHIMFKGTEEIGTVDYASEKPWLDSIAACYDKLSATRDVAERSEVQKDINRLSQKAGEYAIPNEFNGLISRYGGSALNAGTSYDFTFYHNMFTPQYIEQWCWLNSDRLINPVFRMFQGELETVYEEKNMNADQMGSNVLETIMKELFGTQPYAYPILGSTENLKNPKLSDMKKFYEQFYVGCNMGLVLSGDIDSATILPLLEKTFGRIPRGVVPTHQKSILPAITQERTVEVKLPVPLVSMEMLAFKAPTEFERDANAMDIAFKMLSNGKAGLLDSLRNEGRVLMALSQSESLNDAAIGMIIIIPQLLGKSAKAEAACLEQVRRLVRGEFSDTLFITQRQELERESLKELETIDERALRMVMVMSSGHSWKEYVDKVSAIGAVTKSDVMSAANTYLTQPFVRFKKKYGHEGKDRITQPGYTPVVPRNKNSESEYAKRLSRLPVEEKGPRLIDYEHDATTIPLGGQAMLYTVSNPVNELFELSVIYRRGTKSDPRLSASCALLNEVGTDSLTRQQLGSALQVYGADMDIDCSENVTVITVTGEDKYFEPTMRLVSHFLTHAKSSSCALKSVRDGVKAEEKALAEENSDVFSALIQKVVYGSSSSQLNRLTYKEVKKMSGEAMLQVFSDVQSSASDIVYSGSLSSGEVERVVRSTLPVERSQQPYVYSYKEALSYAEPVVYVYDMPKARQTLFCFYDCLGAQPTLPERITSKLLSDYIGGGMSSVLFQEVREFRSMAYSTGSRLMANSRKMAPQSPVGMLSVVGTQSDKAMDAIALVDSLMHDVPFVDKNFDISRQEAINDLSADFPSFREMGGHIALSKRLTFNSDVNGEVYEQLKGTTFDDVKRYYESHVKPNASHRVIAIVGSKKKLNMKTLSKYGKVVMVKEKDLFKK